MRGSHESITGGPLRKNYILLFTVSVHVCSVISNPLQSHGLSTARLLCPWAIPGKNTGVGCHFLLLGIFPTQRRCLLHPLHGQADFLPVESPGDASFRYQLWECVPVSPFMLCRHLVVPSVLWSYFINWKNELYMNYTTYRVCS